MTIIEEKRNNVINCVQKSNDESLLDLVNDLFQFKLENININNELMQNIENIDKKMNSGDFYTDDEVESNIESWN